MFCNQGEGYCENKKEISVKVDGTKQSPTMRLKQRLLFHILKGRTAGRLSNNAEPQECHKALPFLREPWFTFPPVLQPSSEHAATCWGYGGSEHQGIPQHKAAPRKPGEREA